MVEYITDECVIDEYLNNWFTYEELAGYLCIDVGQVKTILQSKDLDEKMLEKIQRHNSHQHFTLLSYNGQDYFKRLIVSYHFKYSENF